LCASFIKYQSTFHSKNNMIDEDVLFKTANTNKEFEDGKSLFQQYANSLDLDLGFQDFSNELKLINKQYNKPKGALLLAYKNNIAIGCAGIRELNSNTAELKRIQLLALAIEIAKELNYKSIRLDTLPAMTKAQELYRSFGFYEISSYRFNPVDGTVFMEKQLK